MTEFAPSSATRDGLYDSLNEHDACGVAMVARLDNEPRHDVVSQGLLALENLEHRGAAGADASTGDGAGILIQIPDLYFREEAGVDLPPAGRYGVAMCFLPRENAERRDELQTLITETVLAEGQVVLGWRDVPVDT